MGNRRTETDGEMASYVDGSPFIDPVVIPIEDHLDLHPFQPKEILSVVREYLDQCIAAGFHEVRLIHGKGKGVQRDTIRALLEKHANVESFHDAPLGAGSWGATILRLKI
jgi:dsDNA-specific endonuclease/ATPase MutS2